MSSDSEAIAHEKRSSFATQLRDETSSNLGSWASSSIGFKLLQKSGWKEGTGLGASEQGRLEPLDLIVKHDKKGIGASRPLKKKLDVALKQDESKQNSATQKDFDGNNMQHISKKASKRLKKELAKERLLEQQQFQRDFFREFWPENI